MFKETGFECPKTYNPADYILKIVNSDFDDQIDISLFEGKYREFSSKHPDNQHNELLDTSLERKRTVTELEVAKLHHLFEEVEGKRASSITHFGSLFFRNLANNALNPGVFGVRLAMYMWLSIIVGILFIGLDDKHDHASVTERMSACFGPAAFFIFMTIAAMPFFMIERGIFEKERMNNLYGSVSYALAQTTASVPAVLFITLITSVVIAFMTGLNNFGGFFLALFVMLLVGEQLAILIAVLIPHYIIGMAIIAGAYGVFMLLEGWIKIYSDIPEYIRWASWIGIHSYQFRAHMINEFEPIDEIEESTFADGEEVLEFYDFDGFEYGELILYMLIYYLCVVLMTIGVLLYKYRTNIPFHTIEGKQVAGLAEVKTIPTDTNESPKDSEKKIEIPNDLRGTDETGRLNTSRGTKP
jgi:hypothetical protein